MDTLTVSARFDGERILLNEPYELKPDMRLFVTIMPAPTLADTFEKEHQDLLRLSLQGLASAYGDHEPEYTIDMVKEVNPDYQRR